LSCADGKVYKYMLDFPEIIHFYKMNIRVTFDKQTLSMRKVIAFYRTTYCNTNFSDKGVATHAQ